jgi:hypothetical protein
MRWISYLLFALVLLVNIRCQKELSYSNPISNSPSPVTAILQGNVLDETGAPAANVTIRVGSKTAITNAKGYFRIRNASLDKYTSLVTAEKTGYFKAFRVFSASTAVNQVTIQLTRRTLAGSFSTTSGGDVTISGSSKLRFAVNTIALASGGSYSGTVNVYAAMIDPTRADIGVVVPGSFLADDKNNNRVILSSYGMMAVELESPSGQKLQLSANNTATIFMEIPAGLGTNAPASIPLWYLDETTGLWKEEGNATKNGNVYEGFVKHFTFWNCDVPGPRVNMTARFVNTAGIPLPYLYIQVRPVGSNASAHGCTDSLGVVHGPIPANVNLVLEVMSPCWSVLYSQNIGPYSADVDLGTITVPNNTQSIVTLEGNLLDCSGSPVTHGFAIIDYDNHIRYASVNSSGHFTTTMFQCTGMPPTCTIIGVDSLAAQQGPAMTVTVVSPLTNAGNILACGTSTLQFFNYDVDGTPYSVSSTVPGDNFSAMDSTGQQHVVYLYGYHSVSSVISFDFISGTSPGTYPIGYLSVNQYNNATPLAPCDVTLTNYAAAPGQYYEGSFSGQFKDAANNTHTLTGSFRVRRQY